MNCYLAGRYSSQATMRVHADQLIALGHHIASRWVYKAYGGDPDPIQAALEDLEDLSAADTLIVFTPRLHFPFPHHEDTGYVTTGGHHVELGLALAWHKTIYLVGSRVNIFHYLPQVTHCHLWTDFLTSITQEPATP